MARTKFSHTVNKQRLQKEADKEKWFVGYDWMLLFFAAVFSGIIVTTMYQTTDPEIVDIAVYQLIIGMVGLMIGTTMNVRKGVVTPGLRIGMPTREDAEKVFVYVTGGFIGLEIFNQVVSSIRFSVIGDTISEITNLDASVNIALTASVMEEALYSFAFTTFFFAVFLYMVVKVTARYNEGVKTAAMVSASIMVGVLFVLIHVGVYGFNPQAVIMLFVNRVVYSMLYIKTKNLTVPTLLHLAHNAMVFLPI
jgi:membrane protease YdiL (CAAX protease family)